VTTKEGQPMATLVDYRFEGGIATRLRQRASERAR